MAIVMLWAPKDTDFVVEPEDRVWRIRPQTPKAYDREGTLTTETAAATNAAIADLRAKGYVVYDPQEFYRNARPLTGVVITDNFSKD